MYKFITKILLVTTVATLIPLSSTFAGGGMPATNLAGSVSSDNTIQLHWSTPDKNDYKYIYDFYQGYAVLMNNKPLALLEFSKNNYSYYNLSGLKKGDYNFEADLYYYDINGIHYVNPSNTVSLTVGDTIQPNPQPQPQPQPEEPKHIKLSVDQSNDKVTLNWTSYTGTFDGYIIKLAEVAKKKKYWKEFPQNNIYYYLSNNTTSFDGLNVIAGHTYQAQIFPYTKNGNGTVDLIKKGQSEKKVIKLESSEIDLHAIATEGKISAHFTASSNKQVDGYAVYVVSGKQGETSLDNASPIYLTKDKTNFTSYPTNTGFYTLKVYAYNELPDGTKVFHQPGSNWVTVEITAN
ncbi:hypothetical protein HZA40_04775 [Candidatus Peregrinibacteria bacterium]|nr:hypothetical protein [Candidatus Peregrinibacteria bacterium]